MGRYYDGDINGKFMFAVQSSSAADRFGSEGHNNYLEYYFDEEHLPTIKEELSILGTPTYNKGRVVNIKTCMGEGNRVLQG